MTWPRQWTPAQDALLRRLWRKARPLPVMARCVILAATLGRHKGNIWKRAVYLGEHSPVPRGTQGRQQKRG